MANHQEPRTKNRVKETAPPTERRKNNQGRLEAEPEKLFNSQPFVVKQKRTTQPKYIYSVYSNQIEEADVSSDGRLVLALCTK